MSAADSSRASASDSAPAAVGAAPAAADASPSWDDRIGAFWQDFDWDGVDEGRRDTLLAAMRALVAERPDGDPEGLYEWASIHDSLGYEQEAVGFYRAALDAGLEGDRRPQAVIQLASSLRNVGDPEAAIALLENETPTEVTGDTAQAFLALALRDAGRPDEALAVAITALARTFPRYSRSLTHYAAALTEPQS